MIPMRSATISSRGHSRRHPAEIEPHPDDLLQQAAVSATASSVLGHLKINRAIATRYDQLRLNDLRQS